MDINKKHIITVVIVLTMTSCSTEQIMNRFFNHNRSHQLELFLETSKDTLFSNKDYCDVCSVVLKNLESTPYFIREPRIMQYSRFQGPPYIFIEYKKETCVNCSVSEGTTILKVHLPDYIFLRQSKPYLSTFTPNFKELCCYGCKQNMIKTGKEIYGEYQIRARYAIENDTIYSNPISIWYLEK